MPSFLLEETLKSLMSAVPITEDAGTYTCTICLETSASSAEEIVHLGTCQLKVAHRVLNQVGGGSHMSIL